MRRYIAGPPGPQGPPGAPGYGSYSFNTQEVAERVLSLMSGRCDSLTGDLPKRSSVVSDYNPGLSAEREALVVPGPPGPPGPPGAPGFPGNFLPGKKHHKSLQLDQMVWSG